MTRDAHFGVSEQEKASVHRQEDARFLFEQARWRGSMYVAGYAVECLLKARLMRMYRCVHLSDLENELHRRGLLSEERTVFIHRLEPLMRLTGGFDRLIGDRNMREVFQVVNRWTPAWRYHSGRTTQRDAEILLTAVDHLLHWIRHNL